MRGLSATLLAAQKAAARKPYVAVTYLIPGSGWQSLSADILAATHVQEDYHSGLSVLLNDRSNAYKDLSIRGKQIRIGHGFTTTFDNEISYAPSLWVTECGPDTKEERNVVIIKAMGIWDRLAGSKPAAEVKWNEAGDNSTIKGIISDILCLATGNYIGADISIDSIVNARYPKFTLTLDQSYADQIIRLLSNTDCELLPVGDTLCLIYPQDSDASIYTYDATHVISANTRRIAMFRPNKVNVKVVRAAGSVPLEIEGSYTDTETGSLITYEEWFQQDYSWGIDTVEGCNALAQSLVERFKRRGNKGVALTKVNCGQELWDMVTLADKWTGQTFTARVGRIEINYQKFNDQGYMMRLGFGAWTEGNQATDGSTPSPAASEVLPSISGRMISPYSIEPWLLRKSMQPYDCTVEPDSANAAYTWNNVVWLAGDIFFQDGTKLTINAGSLNLTAYGDNPVLLYFSEGNSTLQHTSNWQVAIGNECGLVAVVQRAETTDVKASWDSSNGKSGILNTRLLLANMILAEYIKAGQIAVGHLADAVLARLFDSSATSDNIQAWVHANDATLIDGGDIYTNSVTLSKLAAYPTHLLDSYYSSFEVWTDLTAAVPDGWEIDAGSAAQWYACSNPVAHGNYCANVFCNSATQSIRWGRPIYCDENDIVTITVWVLATPAADGNAFIGFKPLSKTGADLGNMWNNSITSGVDLVDNTWTEFVYTGKCPAGTYCIKPLVGCLADNTAGNWYFDDVRGVRSAIIIVHGTPGGTRVEINAAGIDAYNGATRTVHIDAAGGTHEFKGKLQADEVVTDQGYTEALVYDANIAAAEYKNGTQALSKGKLYGIYLEMRSSGGPIGTVRGSLYIRDSGNHYISRNSFYDVGDPAQISTHCMIVGYTGPTTGGTAPWVAWEVQNCNVDTRAYQVTLYISKLL